MAESKQQNLWLKDIDEEKLDKSLEVGEIYPKLLVPNIPEGEQSGAVVKVEILEAEPKVVESDKFQFGKRGFVIAVRGLSDNIKYSLWLPKSLRFKLAVFHKKLGTLEGMKVGIWKEKADLEKYANATVYNVQLLSSLEE